MKINMKLITNKYKEYIIPILNHYFPNISKGDIIDGIDYSILKRYKNSPATLINNYKNKKINTNLIDMCEYILSKEPIITGYGVLFNKPDPNIKNPIVDMLTTFLNNREVDKAKMFEYPKGHEMFKKYNLLQLLDKLDANGLYGVIGSPSSIFYNSYIAGSITMEGRNIISTSAVFFEAFLANNIYFKNLNELIGYIRNIICESDTRKFSDSIYLDKIPSIADTFDHLIQKSGFGYIPTEEDLNIIWDILADLNQEDLTRLFYKNNLFAFMSNNKPLEMVIDILQTLDIPFLAPKDVPKCIEDKLYHFKDVMGEYVFYNHPYVDKLELNRHAPKVAMVLSDTDSCVVNLHPWYRFISDKVKHIPLKINKLKVAPLTRIKRDDKGEYIDITPLYMGKELLKYDIKTDNIIKERESLNTIFYYSNDVLRYSILNIIAFCLETYVNDTLLELTHHTNSYNPNKPCYIKMKNEFLFKRIIVALVAKAYASLIELQEGKSVPVEEAVDVKGLRLKKSTLAAEPKKIMKKLLEEEILYSDNIKPIKIINQLMTLEKMIINSINNGESKYLSPNVINNLYSYVDPMTIGAIKGAYVWNYIEKTNYIDLEKRNAIYSIKTSITPKNIEKIKNKYPEVYKKLNTLFNTKISLAKSKNYKINSINSISIPRDLENIPKWIYEFVDYEEIILSNVKAFTPILEAINIPTFNRNDIGFSNVYTI